MNHHLLPFHHQGECLLSFVLFFHSSFQFVFLSNLCPDNLQGQTLSIPIYRHSKSLGGQMCKDFTREHKQQRDLLLATSVRTINRQDSSGEDEEEKEGG
jgi:hypothetical protein